jgi:peptidase S46-like protein
MLTMTPPLLRAIVGAALGTALLTTGTSARADEGMWPFNRLPKAELERKYEFKASDDWVRHLQRSSVRVGGCSASFVSESGLTLTNHHCAEDCISRLSSANVDYIKRGFYAKVSAEERVCPGYEINQLGEITDVTARIQKATRGLDGEAFHQAFKAESARIEKACATSDDVTCEVVSLYHGGVYELYQYHRYRDVRLVFAPEVEIAFFGGDPDNFNFPRYDLDLTFFRAYEGGKPAVTPDHLSLATTPLRPNDLTFTSGNPGSTERLRTIAELEYLRDHELLETLLGLARYRGFLVEYGSRDAEAERVSKSDLFGVENAFKAIRGEHQALLRPDFFGRLEANERALRAAVARNPELERKYGGAWGAIEKALRARQALEPGLGWIEAPGASRPPWAKTSLFAWARTLVRGADERPKPNEQRLEEFADARLPTLTQRLLGARPLDRKFETKKLAFGLSQLREELGTDHPFVQQVLGKASPDELARELVTGSKLDSVAERKRLWEGGKEAIAASKDPMIQLALRVDSAGRKLRDRYQNEIESVLRKNSELVAKARFEVYGMASAPDATFTPRVSFGTVRGWREPGKVVPSFTLLGGAFERATGRYPYALPKTWLDKQKQLDLSMPLNFVTDNDIVGGNSGSPVVNRQGELVGLVFDGNIHSLGGAYGFDISVNRMVAVDARAIKHALEVIYGAHRVTEELSATPPR